jgi:hypothetical protein
MADIYHFMASNGNIAIADEWITKFILGKNALILFVIFESSPGLDADNEHMTHEARKGSEPSGIDKEGHVLYNYIFYQIHGAAGATVYETRKEYALHGMPMETSDNLYCKITNGSAGSIAGNIKVIFKR